VGTRATWVLCAVLLATTSCAGYSVQQDGMGPGYDVYRPEPYLQGTPTVLDAAGGKVVAYTFKVVWLPNYTKRYRVRSWAGLGAADFTFTFVDGWQLTSVTDKSDNTAVLTALTDLVKHVLPAGTVGKMAEPANGTSADLDPVLYKIEFDECTGEPTCLRRISLGVGKPCP
jgi:hypothetical protein